MGVHGKIKEMRKKMEAQEVKVNNLMNGLYELPGKGREIRPTKGHGLMTSTPTVLKDKISDLRHDRKDKTKRIDVVEKKKNKN